MSNVTRGSGNVFADIGLPDADTHLLKAELVTRIAALLDASKLTQAQAAERLGLSQPDVSKMLNGQFRPISLERLMRCLMALGQTVTIKVEPTPKQRPQPSIRVDSGKPVRRRSA